MSEKELETKIATELRKSGFSIKENVKVGKWQADIVLETPRRGAIILEVKNRKIGIPDVLSVATMANNMSGSTITSGTIVTNSSPTEPVLKTAVDNDIGIWTIKESQQIAPKMIVLLSQVMEVELLLNKLSKQNNICESLKGLALAKTLHNRKIINDEIVSKINQVQQIRNKAFHGQGFSEDILDSAINASTEVIKNLNK